MNRGHTPGVGRWARRARFPRTCARGYELPRVPAALLFLAVSTVLPAVTIDRIEYNGRPVYRMANGEVELFVTADVGPRILRYAFAGGPNLFKEISDEEDRRITGGAEWKLYGGHRIWVGPEDPRYTYMADNEPPAIAVQGRSLAAASPADAAGIRKAIRVELAEQGTGVRVVHSLTNETAWTLRLAPWALTMLAPGGTAVALLPPKGTHPEHLAPANPLVMWRFTNFADPRWSILEKYLVLRGDPERKDPEKAGLYHPEAIVAGYLLGETFFLKRYRTLGPASAYPDMGSAFETFTNGDFLELETLGPLTELAPGETVEHVEEWTLHRGVRVGEWSDAEIDRVLGPLVE